MRLPLVGVTISLLSYFAGVAAQTFTDCNPREKSESPRLKKVAKRPYVNRAVS